MKNVLLFACLFILSTLAAFAQSHRDGGSMGGLDTLSIVIGLVVGVIIGYLLGSRMGRK